MQSHIHCQFILNGHKGSLPSQHANLPSWGFSTRLLMTCKSLLYSTFSARDPTCSLQSLQLTLVILEHAPIFQAFRTPLFLQLSVSCALISASYVPLDSSHLLHSPSLFRQLLPSHGLAPSQPPDCRNLPIPAHCRENEYHQFLVEISNFF